MDLKIDCKDMRCPRPIIEVAKQMRSLSIGDTIEIEANDPVFRADIEAWCRKTKNELVSLIEDDGLVCATVKKVA